MLTVLVGAVDMAAVLTAREPAGRREAQTLLAGGPREDPSRGLGLSSRGNLCWSSGGPGPCVGMWRGRRGLRSGRGLGRPGQVVVPIRKPRAIELRVPGEAQKPGTWGKPNIRAEVGKTPGLGWAGMRR